MPADKPCCESRFIPGNMLCQGRYRIVSLLGKGSMGEVYRAEDMQLGDSVALKFLPETRERDDVWVQRFLNEVKVARRVSHPHVCRVHDVGAHEGMQFLSMEYIGGEDLLRLLKRMGHRPLPRDKALEIAHQLCSGLAAIHDQGILHRDLKPANVMIDERGLAKITDFGIAGWVGHIANPGEGSYPYMAPEQLEKREVSARSDVYALGLVIYELFTGTRAFAARERPPLEPPSTVEEVEDLDPRIDELVLRCARPEPQDRPASAYEVAAALPQAPPPEARGERFPPPEVLLQPAGGDGLRAAVAWPCLLALIAGLLLVAHLAGRTHLTRFLDDAAPPAVLAEGGRAAAAALGGSPRPRHAVYGFSFDPRRAAAFARSRSAGSGRPQPESALSNPVGFWYRQSPRHLTPRRSGSIFRRRDDPPAGVPGMVGVELDLQGRLRRFDAVPLPASSAPAGGEEPDWAPLLALTELPQAGLRRVEPTLVPAVYADHRAAWEGSYPRRPETPVRLEAAAHGGRPLWARVMPSVPGPTGATGTAAATGLLTHGVSRAVFNLWFLGALIGGILLARRHYRCKAADRRAGMRLIVYMLVAGELIWLLGTGHTAGRAELISFRTHLAWSLFFAGLAWTLYTAFEPLLRRDWPQRMASWVRLMHGRFRDPRLGRDTLFGALFGVASVLWAQLCFLAPGWLGRPLPAPDRLSSLVWQVQRSSLDQQLEALRGIPNSLAVAIHAQVEAVLVAFFAIAGFFLLWLLLRRPWAAGAVALAVWTLLLNPAAGYPAQDLLAAGVACSLWLVVLYRVGFLAAVVATSVAALLGAMPLTLDPGAWYAPGSGFVLLVVLAAGVYGGLVSLGGKEWFPQRLAAGDAAGDETTQPAGEVLRDLPAGSR